MSVQHFYFALILSMSFHQFSLSQVIKLKAYSTEIRYNDSAYIIWNADTKNEVFLYPLGQVKPAGEIKIPLTETTQFVLLYWEGAHVFRDSLKITVSGSTRGDTDTLPQIKYYQYPITFYQDSKSGSQLVSRIFNVLQDTMAFSVAKSIASDSTVLLQTRMSKKNYLDRKDDQQKKISYRCLSYLIEIKRTMQDQYSITVSSLIQYKKQLYNTLFSEKDDRLYINQNRKIRQFIN
jgi:hypothetical protein